MLQVEVLSGGDVTEQLEVDGNQVYSESGKMPEFMAASVGRLRGKSIEERVQRFIEGTGNQISLKKGNGARVFDGKGKFDSHAPEKKAEAELKPDTKKTKRTHKAESEDADQSGDEAATEAKTE